MTQDVLDSLSLLTTAYRSPLNAERALSAATGAVLDPIMAPPGLVCGIRVVMVSLTGPVQGAIGMAMQTTKGEVS